MSRFTSRSNTACLLGLCLAANYACALDPSLHISQYAHSAWRLQDGAFSGDPTAITQTADGYVWIGTPLGLLRFDGIRFVQWASPDGEQLPSQRILALLSDRDGSLWIGTTAGLSHWHDGHLTNYLQQRGSAQTIIQTRSGTIWLVFLGRRPSGQLCEVSGAELRCYGAAEGVPASDLYNTLAEDSDGNLWLGGRATLLRWTRSSHNVTQLEGLRGNVAGLGQVTTIVPETSSSLWMGISAMGHGLGLEHVTAAGVKTYEAEGFNGERLEVLDMFLDRRHALWIGTNGQGLYRIYDGSVEHFGSDDGLSGNFVRRLFEDREGDLWAITTKGLDNLRDLRVASFSTREGLTVSAVSSVFVTRGGTVWVGGSGSLDSIDGKRIVSYVADKSFPAHHNQVTSLLEDHAGHLWVGMDSSLFIFDGSHFRELKKPNGNLLGLVVGMTEDKDNNVWVEVSGDSRTLFRFRDLAYQDEYPDPTVPGGRRVTADPSGGIWIGLMSGDLARFRDGHLDTFAFNHPKDLRGVEQVTVTTDGLVLGATAFGLVGWSNGDLLTMTVANGLPCDQIFSFMFDNAGALWLNSQCGLVRISPTDLNIWRNAPSSKLRIRSYDVLDGVQLGFQSPFLASAKSPNGRLWYVQNHILQTFDPQHFAQNPLPPPVHIEAVIADRTSYAPKNGLSLPSLTRDIEIDYTALSFVVPQRVRFRYELVGRDNAWQDPGTRRQAFYGDLPPGNYVFHVIACNNDGLWNDEGATLEFHVAPAWYQTRTFLIGACVGGIVFIWGIYRLRLRQLAISIGRRLNERIAERNRLARDLHDTLLQTIQGTKHLVDAALDGADDPSAMRKTMERLSDWLDRASHEGRSALNALRISTATTNTLADSFRVALEECQTDGKPAIDLTTDGGSKNLNPIVREEVYRIGLEAIQNAARHAKADQIIVRLSYGRDFTLTVIDNGQGMSADILAEGKERHFGLKGMRERAQQIGGECVISSSAKLGTRIELTVPGPTIYSGDEGKMRTLLSAFKRPLDLDRPRD